jgi:hypothetical protein
MEVVVTVDDRVRALAGGAGGAVQRERPRVVSPVWVAWNSVPEWTPARTGCGEQRRRGGEQRAERSGFGGHGWCPLQDRAAGCPGRPTIRTDLLKRF